MAKLVRYTTSQQCPPTAPDWNSDVHHGSFETLPDGARAAPAMFADKDCLHRPELCRSCKRVGQRSPAEPLIFLKPPSSLIAHGDAIVYPAISQNVHFEGELGVVIGKKARHVTRENAMEYVAGYTCLNDVTARDIQRKDVQFTRGKGFDTFCAAGPYLVPREEVS